MMLSGIVFLFGLIPVAAEVQRPLTVREAIEIALRNNPELAVEKVQLDHTASGVLSAKGLFDPLVRIDASRRSARNPAGSILEGANGRVDVKEWRQSASVKQKLPWQGMSWEAAFENLRTSSTNPFNTFNPFHTPRATLSFTAPLLRFRATDNERTELRVRQRENKLASAQVELKINNLVAQVEAAYWEFVAAIDALRNSRELLELAEQSSASTARLVKEGEFAEAEETGSRSVLQRRKESVATAMVGVKQAENALKMLLTRNAADPLWAQSLEPVDQKALIAEIDETEAAAVAVRNRPELKAADLQLQIADLQAKLAHEAMKPAVDLNFSYTSQGLAGREVASGPIEIPGFPAAVTPPLLIGGFGRASDQVFRNRFPVFQAGLSIELPLRNRSALGRSQQADLARKKADLERVQLEKLIALEARQAFVAVNGAGSRIEAAEAAAAAARDRLASELRLLNEGQSSNLNVNVRQNELADSKQLVIAAWRNYNMAHVEVRRVTAQSLSTFGVKVQ